MGVTSTVFGAVVVVLLIVAAVGYALYFTTPHGQTGSGIMTETVTQTVSTTSGTSSGGTGAVQFAPATGQMVDNAWLLVEPTASGQFAVSIHAEGLESTQGMGSVYIVEGAESSGAMAVVPVGPNATASEFETTSNGVGSYFILLSQNPYTTFESVQIVYLPGMEMTNATVVATATLAMMTP
jgi:hypothetical protein